MVDEKRRVKAAPSPSESTTPTAFYEAATLYLDYSKRKHARQTFEYKRFVIKNFANLHGSTAMEEISPQQIHAYLSTRPTNHNYNAHRKDLCALWAYAIRVLKIVKENPCLALEKMPYTPPRKVIPAETDILKLIAVADPKTDERDLLMVMLLTLARVDEILRLTWADVSFDQAAISLWTRKRRDGNLEADTLPMSGDLKEILLKRWETRTQNDWVFYNTKTGTRYNRRPKFMAGLCNRAGVPFFGFHALRHFMASFLADRQKVSKMTISRLLRHRALGTTEIYLQSIGEGQRSALESVKGMFDVSGNEVRVRGALFGENPHLLGDNTEKKVKK
jgi:integrase